MTAQVHVNFQCRVSILVLVHVTAVNVNLQLSAGLTAIMSLPISVDFVCQC